MYKKINLQFSLIQGLYWTGFGMIFAYLTAYYQHLGLSPLEIGYLTSLVSLAAIVGQPVVGMLADRTGKPPRVLIVFLAIGILLSLILFLPLGSIWLIGVFSILVSFVIQALAPVIDSWTMDVKAQKPGLDYGTTRSMGSVAFAIAMAVVGRLFDLWGIEYMFLLAAVFFLGTISVIASVRVPAEHHETTPERDRARGFFTPPMIFLLAISCIGFMTFRSVQVFLPVLLVEMGGSNSELGYSLGVMAISEVPFMVMSSWLLTRHPDTRILLVSFGFFFLRIFVNVLAPNPGWIIVAQALQGPSFGLFLPAFVHLINRLSPPGAKAFGQTVGSVATFGLGGVGASAFGGILTEQFGVVSMFGIMSGVMALTALAYGIFAPRLRH